MFLKVFYFFFKLFVHQGVLKKNHSFHKILSSTPIFNSDIFFFLLYVLFNLFGAPSQNIKMISEGSHGSEDWSNGC